MTQKNSPSQIKFIVRSRFPIHPRNLTWNLKIMVFKWTFLFQGLIFRFHVKFRGCIHPLWRGCTYRCYLILPNGLMACYRNPRIQRHTSTIRSLICTWQTSQLATPGIPGDLIVSKRPHRLGYFVMNMLGRNKFQNIIHMGVSKIRGTPTWMVKIVENPIEMDDLGVKPTILGNPHTKWWVTVW